MKDDEKKPSGFDVYDAIAAVICFGAFFWFMQSPYRDAAQEWVKIALFGS